MQNISLKTKKKGKKIDSEIDFSSSCNVSISIFITEYSITKVLTKSLLASYASLEVCAGPVARGSEVDGGNRILLSLASSPRRYCKAVGLESAGYGASGSLPPEFRAAAPIPCGDATVWDPKTDCCSWYCLECGDATVNHRVTSLIIQDGDISVQIPAEVGDLPYLTSLIFRKLTNLTGQIQPTIAKLKNLTFL
ncbi:hypothetical protein ARALYDRAFT_918542 [Arabidopsis lyrata subsp. lyrata]|uniref:Leucine-rich repeat-containing N-terminal plant-type domain-containing protein n=1 Tax=Arabidopsis lyrata subsp. lyrata TaxID=81972 RepID=D7MTR6_ARALL|nr:hypothetical protein ARALYDRAFT_918542 [Arabidopsis lyrata subsp. lyrata]